MRRELYRWAGWFLAANVPLAMLGQMALLAVVLPFLVVGPLIAVWPARRVVMPVAVLIVTLGLVLLVVDTNLFVERRFHLGLFTAVLFHTATWVFVGIVFVIVIALAF